MKNTKFAFILFFFITFILVWTAGNVEAYRLSEQRLIFRIDRNPTQQVRVYNTRDYEIGMRVYPEPAADQAPEEYLGDWLIVYPPQFNLAPGEERTVRFSVRPPEGIEAGEYRSLLYFEQLPPRVEPDDTALEEEPGMSVGMNFTVKTGINIYGQYAELDYWGGLENVEVAEQEEGKHMLMGDFINEGNAHLRMEAALEILNAEGELVDESSRRFVVHRSSSATFREEMQLPEGDGSYTVILSFSQGGEIIHEYQTEIAVDHN